jgi:peptidoglycan/xylan/chitin deacetylase (PgdA/CDA1 family)
MRGTLPRKSIIHEVNTGHKAIAITFDDGPNPAFTPQFMDVFREHGGHATFFTIGEQLEKCPDIAQSIIGAGHEMGNHTWTHPHMTEMDPASRKFELERTHEWIVQITGVRPMTFRPPFLESDEELLDLAASSGYHTIGALNLETEDWRQPGVDQILSKTRDYIRNGSILLFHDGYGDRSQSLEAIRIIVPEIVAQGYQLVTVSELLRMAAGFDD